MSDTPPRPDRLGRWVLGTGVALALLFTLQHTAAERWWWTSLLTYAPQNLLLTPLLAVLLLGLLRGRPGIRRLSAALLVFILFAFLDFAVPRPGPRPAANLRLLTYNIHDGINGLPRVMDTIERSGADVVCLQETDAEEGHAGVAPLLRQRFVGWHQAGEGELLILTRRPVVRTRYHRLENSEWRAVEATVDLGGPTVTVLTAHIDSSAGPEMFARGLSQAPDFVNRWNRIRRQQLDRLFAIADGIPGPLVICGDFNTPPRGSVYHALSRRYREAYRQVGFGFGYTFRTNIPCLRIDYAWLAGGVQPVRCWPLAVAGSDHRPLWVELAVPPSPTPP